MNEKILGKLNGKRVYLFKTLEDYFEYYYNEDEEFFDYAVIEKNNALMLNLMKQGKVTDSLNVHWLTEEISFAGEYKAFKKNVSDKITNIIEEIRAMGRYNNELKIV